MLKRWLAWSGGWKAWINALVVLVITVLLIILDLTVASVHRFGSEHSFTSSVVSGLLVLLLTLLIVDRVSRMRKIRDQSRAIAAQAAVVLAQAVRAADAVKRPSPTDDDREEASGEVRTYTLMLFISAPVLIDARVSRAFLEAAQRVAAQLSRTLRATGDEQTEKATARLDDGVKQLRDAAAPMLETLNREQLAAVSSDETV